ncbi:hypothetical protein [Lysobacter gummosus]|uniref:hypothetical protein n=1 Tax=Lysobacter gummosus TaxID=262324 RepID=UPI0036324FF4
MCAALRVSLVSRVTSGAGHNNNYDSGRSCNYRNQPRRSHAPQNQTPRDSHRAA